MSKFSQGQFYPINKDKYIGDVTKIFYRSHWEFCVMRFLDKNPKIAKWGSEVIVVKYICGTDNRLHRYFVDFVYQTQDNKTYLIEVKPKHETQPPKFKKSQRKKTMVESAKRWTKNSSKWAAAEKLCEKNGWHFKIWTEDTLNKLGLKV